MEGRRLEDEGVGEVSFWRGKEGSSGELVGSGGGGGTVVE